MTKKINYLISAFLISLPFERLLTVDLFGFTLKLSYVFGLIFLAVVVINIKKINLLPLKKEEFFLLLFNLWSFITVLWAIDKERSIIISLLLLFMSVTFIAIRRTLDPNKIDKFLYIFLCVGVGVSIFSFWQFFADSIGISTKLSFLRPEYVKGVFPFPRVQATFLEPLFFANFLVIPFFVAMYYAVKTNIFKYYSYFTVISLALLLTLSRGGIFSTLLMFAVLSAVLLFIKKSYHKPIIKLFISGLIAVFLLFSLIFLTTGRSGVKGYVQQSSKTVDVSADEQISDTEYLRTRNFTTDLAIKKFKENPILGIGTASFGKLPEFKPLLNRGSIQTVNNEYLEILVENGLVGFILFFIFVVFVVFKVVKKSLKKSLINLMFLAIISTWLIQYLTFSSLNIIYIWVLFGIALI